MRRFRYAPALLETLTHDETAPDRLRSRPAYAALLPGYMIGGTLAAIALGSSTPPDVVHVHWPVPHAWFGGVVRSASGGRTAVVSSFYSVEIRWVERRLGWAIPFLRWAIESSDAVTAISSATAEAVGGYTHRHVPVIPFGAALADSASRPSVPNPGPEHAGVGAAPARLLFVGRLVERKGIHILIRALARVRECTPATLTIVGEGPLRAELEAEADRLGVAEAVRFAGRVDAGELENAYRESDVFVLPAIVDRKGDTEGLGVVLLEALEFGLPVIASDAGGIPDIVRDGETGWLVPPGDVVALSRAISQAVDDRAEAAERARRGRGEVRTRFALPRIVDDLIECYGGAVGARRGSSAAADSHGTLREGAS